MVVCVVVVVVVRWVGLVPVVVCVVVVVVVWWVGLVPVVVCVVVDVVWWFSTCGCALLLCGGLIPVV